METSASRRRALVIGLGVALLVLFLSLAALNAFNLKFLNPDSPRQALVFIALSTLAFLLFLGVLVLLVRNVLKLYADHRSRVLGTRLRTRMLWGAVLVSLVPLVFMFAFSYLLMNRAMERWFSQPVKEMRQNSDSMAAELYHYIAANARSEADSIAADLDAFASPRPLEFSRDLGRHAATLQGGFAIVYSNKEPVAQLHVPQLNSSGRLKSPNPADNTLDENPTGNEATQIVPLSGPMQSAILQAAGRNDGSIYNLANTDYVLATAALRRDGLVVVGLPVPVDIAKTTSDIQAEDTQYQTLFRERRQVRNLYMGLLLLMTSLALFACCWLALNLSKQVTRPVESLADAMEAIAGGDYAHRVSASATEELGELVDTFNAMAADLESARTMAERSTAQLSELNTALLARRTELETIIETIPSGVVTLSADRRLLLANRAFLEMLDPGGQLQFNGVALESIFPPEALEPIDRLLRRSHRMGFCVRGTQLQQWREPVTALRHRRVAGKRPGARPPGLRARAGRHDRGSPCAKAERLEGGRPPRRARDQEPAHPYLAQRGTHPAPRRPADHAAQRVAHRIALPSRHPAFRGDHQRLRANHALAGRPVLCPGRVSQRAPAACRPQCDRREHNGSLCGPSRQDPHGVLVRSRAAAGVCRPGGYQGARSPT